MPKMMSTPKKEAAPEVEASETEGGTQIQPKTEAPQQTTSQKAAVQSSAPSGKPQASFVKTGSHAQAAYKSEEARAEAAREAAGKPWRFFIRGEDLNKDFTIIFLDGELDTATNMLKLNTWMEHQPLNKGGKPEQYVCVAENEPCPLCAAGDTPVLVGGFTILDCNPYTIKKGEKEGQVVPFSRKLYVCKRGTLGILQKLAAKYGGLKHRQFDVTRTGAMKPNVGDIFMPVSEWEEGELVEKYGAEATAPVDWNEAITYRTAKELVELGVADAIKSTSTKKGPSADLSKEF